MFLLPSPLVLPAPPGGFSSNPRALSKFFSMFLTLSLSLVTAPARSGKFPRDTFPNHAMFNQPRSNNLPKYNKLHQMRSNFKTKSAPDSQMDQNLQKNPESTSIAEIGENWARISYHGADRCRISGLDPETLWPNRRVRFRRSSLIWKV